MKNIISFHRLLSSAAAVALLALAVPQASAALSAEVFYDALDPYGDWIKTDEYGYAFQPREVGEDWRPYTDGNWVYTDAGWTWVSEEPFGWATYHYGRWANLEETGWVWVPDTEWAPAWVSWRRSNEYVGWSPLPPEARFERKVGFHAWVDSNYDIGPTNYSFVRVRDLGAPRLRTVIVAPRENITIIRETRNITNVTYVNNVVINNGPDYDVVVRESAQPIRRLRLERSRDFDDVGAFRDGRARTTVTGDSLRIVAPAFTAMAASVAPKKVARTVTNVQVNRGWRDAGPPEQVKQVRATIAAEQKAPPSVRAATKLRGATRPPAPDKDAAVTAKEAAPAETPGATPVPKKPGKPGRTAAEDPAAPPAVTTDAPATPAPKAGTAAGQKGRPDRPGAKDKKAPPPTTSTPPEGTPPREDSPPSKPQIAPGEPLPPGQPGAGAPRPKRGVPTREIPPAEAPAAERKMPKAGRTQDPPPPSKEAAPERNPKAKGPKGPRTEATAPAPDRAPAEKKRPDAPDRGLPLGRGPTADREAPGAANRPPEVRPPTEVKGPAKAGKGAPGKPDKGEKPDDDKKKKDDAPQ